MQGHMIKKDDSRLPDAYGLVVHSFGQPEPKTYEIVQHRLIDKVYDFVLDESGRPVMRDGNPVMQFVGISPVPCFEYVTKEGIIGYIPTNSYSDLHFDERFTKMTELKKEHDIKIKKRPI